METEENKYYIPEIEEFHIGFEYEYCNGPLEENDWEKDIISEYDFSSHTSGGVSCENWFEEIYKELRSTRVKYLDQEDIESLGWKFIKHHPGTTQLDFKKGIYYLDFDSNFRGKSWLRIYEGDNQSEEFNFFTGFIKNKSELKILMKQLGI